MVVIIVRISTYFASLLARIHSVSRDTGARSRREALRGSRPLPAQSAMTPAAVESSLMLTPAGAEPLYSGSVCSLCGGTHRAIYTRHDDVLICQPCLHWVLTMGHILPGIDIDASLREREP